MHLGIIWFTLISRDWDYLRVFANHCSCEIVLCVLWNSRHGNPWDNYHHIISRDPGYRFGVATYRKSNIHFCLNGLFFASPLEWRLSTNSYTTPSSGLGDQNKGNLNWKKRWEVCCLREFAGDEIKVYNLASFVGLCSLSPLSRKKN